MRLLIRRFVVATAVTIAMTACSPANTDAVRTNPAGTCEDGLEQAVELLRSELPTYDYDPAANLEGLIKDSELVLAGHISFAERVEPADSNGDESWTSLTVEQVELLFDFAEPTQPPTKIGLSSFWPDGAGDDPLSPAVELNVGFVAFLDRWGAAPGGFAIDLQGLAVGCAGSELPAVSIIEPLPRDGGGLTFDQLRAASAVAGRMVANDLTTGLDGPVIRYPIAGTSNEALLAEISGVIEIEGDCLYVQPDWTDERFPVVLPANTLWNNSVNRVVLPSREAVGETDLVIASGGYGSVEDVETIAGTEAADLSRSCLDNEFGEIAIVTNQPDAIRPDR